MIDTLEAFDDHEGVHMFHDAESGLRAVVAVHSTHLGPGGGGTRLWTYPDMREAVRDALRLSRAMSYKTAMAGLALGGGKGVILRPDDASGGKFDRAALFAAYGRALNACGGTYITAEDVGVGPEDMDVIATQTRHVTGTSTGGGDPSPWTAEGVFLSIRASCEAAGLRELKGLRVAVQGLGSVGWGVAERLHAAGAHLVVADIDPVPCARAERMFGADVIDTARIHAADVDVFSPCALGEAVNADTVDAIRAKVVCGGANNQLAAGMGARLAELGVLYAPDYVVNAGGIINVASELRGTYDPAWTRAKVEAIPTTLAAVFDRARTRGERPETVADAMARERIGRG